MPTLAKIAGVIIIIAGLHFLGILHIPLLHREARYHADARPAGLIGAYATFVVFAWRDHDEYVIPAAEVARIDRANREARRAAMSLAGSRS